MKPQSSLSHEKSTPFAFRVSEEDYEKIAMLIDISGYVRQGYDAFFVTILQIISTTFCKQCYWQKFIKVSSTLFRCDSTF